MERDYLSGYSILNKIQLIDTEIMKYNNKRNSHPPYEL